MNEEQELPDKLVPDEEADAATEADVKFGAQDEKAQADEWQEDEREVGG